MQMTLDEKQEALRKAQLNRERVKRRNRINLYKNTIIVLLCVVSVAPALFSMYLLYQVSDIERQVSFLANQQDASDSVKLEDAVDADGKEVKASGEKSANMIVNPGQRVYLTFDDGPSANIDEILDILAGEEVKATFFVVGKTDEASMAAYKKIVEQGHGIGIHSYTHEYDKIYASLEAFQMDVNSMSDLIYAATGVRTHLYRFPGGSANSVCETSMDKLIRWLNKEGYIYYDWNALNGDAVTKDLSPKTLVSNIMKNVKQNRENGTDSTVLMHDLANKHNTVESLKPLIDRLKGDGYVLDQPLSEDVNPIQQKVVK
ncbi:MAG: polysaccharide deacetylase [Lachnospira sp.]|nr:polysaccharide deacetylase [Lachnospira sp.]